MKTSSCYILFGIFILFSAACYSQNNIDSIRGFTSAGFEAISSKANKLEKKLDKTTEQAISRARKQEYRLKKKLAGIDSVAAANTFGNIEERYRGLEERLKQKNRLSQYIPHLDSLHTSLEFLNQNKQLLGSLKDGEQKLQGALDKVKNLETQLQKAEDVRKFLKERSQLLKDQLGKFGFAKQLKSINKQAYYYTEQLNEYKVILKDPKKAEKKLISLLSQTKTFHEFLRKNSMLASLFRSPGDADDPALVANISGLQTRFQVNQFLQQQIGNNNLAAMRQNMQAAQSGLEQLKNKIGKAGAVSTDYEMPDFKPNSQKTKSFFKRLEYGVNIQSQKKNNFFPTTSDIGLSIGYKINDKSTIGLGASYKMGWGNGWNDIKLSHQGMGLRSFIDWKLKGSFYISGGYEQNYKPQLQKVVISSLSGQEKVNAWQQSGLIGLSKIVSLKSKTFKKTKLQLLWDFMSYRQRPVTQPVLFRVGYNL